MIVVDLWEVWLHNADQLDDFVTVRAAEVADVRSRDGQVRTYLTGRRRIVTTPRRGFTVNVTCLAVPRTTADELEARSGSRSLYRDPWGRVAYGTLFTVDVEDIPGVDRVNVTFTFVATTTDMSV